MRNGERGSRQRGGVRRAGLSHRRMEVDVARGGVAWLSKSGGAAPSRRMRGAMTPACPIHVPRAEVLSRRTLSASALTLREDDTTEWRAREGRCLLAGAKGQSFRADLSMATRR